jgi:hypothetical protein
VKVRFGTLVLEFEGVGDLGGFRALYDAHSAAAADVPQAIVRVLLDPSAGGVDTWQPGRPMGQSTVADGLLTVERRVWTIEVPLAEQADVRLRLRSWRPDDFEQAVGTLIQILAPLRAGAVCLHGSSVKRGDEGFAFIAASETGKTTVARLSREIGYTVLAEEMTYVGWPAGDERPWVYSLPARERNDIRTPLRDAAPLAGIYCLKQHSADVVESLDSRERLLELAARAAIGARSPVVMDAVLEVLARLDRALPLRRLRFTPSIGFWEALDTDRERRRTTSA